MNTPDPQKHLTMSLAKSGMRILGYILLSVTLGDARGAVVGVVLVGSEILGIIEELV